MVQLVILCPAAGGLTGNLPLRPQNTRPENRPSLNAA